MAACMAHVNRQEMDSHGGYVLQVELVASHGTSPCRTRAVGSDNVNVTEGKVNKELTDELPEQTHTQIILPQVHALTVVEMDIEPWDKMSEDGKDFIRRCLVVDEEQRWTAQEVCVCVCSYFWMCVVVGQYLMGSQGQRRAARLRKCIHSTGVDVPSDGSGDDGEEGEDDEDDDDDANMPPQALHHPWIAAVARGGSGIGEQCTLPTPKDECSSPNAFQHTSSGSSSGSFGGSFNTSHTSSGRSGSGTAGMTTEEKPCFWKSNWDWSDPVYNP